MQLSAKALLRPFTSTASTDPVDAADSNISDPINNDLDDDLPSLEDVGDDDDDDDDDDEGGESSGEDGNGEDDDDDDEDPFDGLTPEECQELVDDTAAVKTTLDKVRSFIIHIIIANCFDLQDSQTLICHYPFYDNRSSSLA
jgi:hypothetical protein